jgi:hypothetical protein
MPKVDVILIEVPDEVGGYGAKGVGEIGLRRHGGHGRRCAAFLRWIRRLHRPWMTHLRAIGAKSKSVDRCQRLGLSSSSQRSSRIRHLAHFFQ